MADAWQNGKKVEEVNFTGGTFDSSGRKLTPGGGAGGSVATDSIFTAKGDIAVGTGASTAARVAVGPNDYVLTADSVETPGVEWAIPRGYEFHYKQITSPVTIASTTEASGTSIIAADATTFDGSPVIVEFFSPDVGWAGTTTFLVVSLFEGATQIARLGIKTWISATSATLESEMHCRYRFTPSAGSHTYTITAYKSGGTCTIGAGASGTAAYGPAFVRFTKA